MKDEIILHGVVLQSAPSRDFDKRLLVLTKERGKVTIWAAGARKPTSRFLASTRTFVFAAFHVTEGKSGYNLHSVEVTEFFEDIAIDLVKACYGSYILELSSLMAQENLESTDMVNLIFVSLRALIADKIPDKLIRRIFELRMLLLNGSYTETPPLESSEATVYTWQYILSTPVTKLYSFTLSDAVLAELSQNIDFLLRQEIPYDFKSLRILNEMQ